MSTWYEKNMQLELTIFSVQLIQHIRFLAGIKYFVAQV